MEIKMVKYDNQEAFILSAKRVQSRITRAKELNVGELGFDGLKDLVENLSLAKAIQVEKTIDLVTKGQEFYVQTLIDSVTKPVEELIDIEYAQATLELGSEEDILASLLTLQKA